MKRGKAHDNPLPLIVLSLQDYFTGLVGFQELGPSLVNLFLDLIDLFIGQVPEPSLWTQIVCDGL